MPRRITIQPHLSVEELERRYRGSKDPVERSHYQIIWLLVTGRSTEEVAAVTGYSRSWIYELVWGYNRLGPESLGDQRHQHPGAQTLLNDVEQAQLWQVLQSPPADGGLWNGRKVADSMSQLRAQPVSRQRGWEYLKAMQFRLRVPRPEHYEADPVEQQEWKKKIGAGVQALHCRTPRLRRAGVGHGRTSGRT